LACLLGRVRDVTFHNEGEMMTMNEIFIVDSPLNANICNYGGLELFRNYS